MLSSWCLGDMNITRKIENVKSSTLEDVYLSVLTICYCAN